MTNDQLGPRARSMIDAALSTEPLLDEPSAARMRARVLGAVEAALVATTTASAAGAGAVSVAPGAASADAAGSGAGAGGVVATSAGLGVTTKVIALCVVIGATLGGGALALRSHDAPTAVLASAREAKVRSAPLTAPAASPAAPPPTSAVAAASPRSRPDSPVRVVDDAPFRPPSANHLGEGIAHVAHSTPAPAAAPAAEAASSPTQVDGPAPAAAQTVTPRSNLGALNGEAFSRELESLDRARNALAAGDGMAAIRETETIPSSGAFAEERAALRTVALCMVGRRSEGNLELARFRSTFPRSIQTERAERACLASEVTDSRRGGHSPK